MDNIIDFDELCERLGTAYVKFLCALNALEEEHDEAVKKAGCDLMQGWKYYHALPQIEAEKILNQ